MTEVFEAEATSTDLIEGKDVINIEVIGQKALPQFLQYNAQITADLEKLNLPELIKNASEDNLAIIKKSRTIVRKETAEDEERRKFVEKQYTKPLDNWKEMYKKYVFTPRANADKDLKTAQDKIEDDLRKKKTVIFEKMFYEKKKELKIHFVKFEDVKLNVQLSTPEAQLKDDINNFFDKVQRDLSVIETDVEKNRILVQYIQHLDLAKAIVDVKRAIELEQQLKTKQEEALKRSAEVLEEKTVTNTPKQVSAPQTFTVSFTVTGTKEEIISIRTFMKSRGIKYE